MSESSGAPPAPKGDPPTILVVDDEPEMEPLVRQQFRRQIRRGEVAFRFASDGVEALECLDEHDDVGIVLTDINMPRMDGLTFLGRLAEMQRPIHAIVVSAYGDMANIRKAMNLGAFDFLMKPIDLDDLSVTVGRSTETMVQRRRADLARDLFGRYVSDDIVTTLLDDPEAIRLGGQELEVVILMSDLRGFSAASERLRPEEVVEMLNVYFDRMMTTISGFGGTVIDIIGDGLLVVFGAPIPYEDGPLRAMACALTMQTEMGAVNAELDRRGLPPCEMGIGINIGDVVVGNIGSAQRLKYSVVGSHVNLASRIESCSVGGQVLISEWAREAAGDDVQVGEGFEVSAKGFSQPVCVFPVEAIAGSYDLKLEREAAPEPLARPVPVRFAVLEGKRMSEAEAEGEIVALSPTRFALRTAHALARLDDLYLKLPNAPDAEAYAKVVTAGEGDTYQVRFTADAQAFVAALRGEA